MANEELNIAKDKARLTVIGNSYPDVLTDSGFGFDIPELIVDALDELGIELPDWGQVVPPDLVIGLDPDTEIPTLEYPDPEWEEPEWPDPDISNHDWPEPDWPENDLPDIIKYPMPELDWDDFIDKLEDLDLDPDMLKDLSFVGLDDLGIPTLVSLDMDFNIREDNCPAAIVIVTQPKKTEYQNGQRIDLTGMVVTAKKADGSTWTSAEYPNGHIPLGELILSDSVANYNKSKETITGIPEFEEISGFESTTPFETMLELFQDNFGPATDAQVEGVFNTLNNAYKNSGYSNSISYTWCKNDIPPYETASIGISNYAGFVVLTGGPDSSGYYSAKRYTYWLDYYIQDGEVRHCGLGLQSVENIRYTLYQGIDPDDSNGAISNANVPTTNIQTVGAEWTSPCGVVSLSDDLQIKVKQNGGGGR